MEGENQVSIDMEDSKVQQLMGSLVRMDTLQVPVTAPLSTTHSKIASHGIDFQEGEGGGGGGKGQFQENEDSGKGHASSKLLELAESNHLLQIRNASQGQTPPRSPVEERLVGSPTVDNTVDQMLANTVNTSLWSPTPRSRSFQTPSPTLDQAYSPTPRDNSSQDEDLHCLTPVEIMSDSDRRLEEANKEISKLTRQAFQMSAEKELVEGDLDFWKSRAYELERRLRNAEEDAVQKEEQVESLERQLEIARQPLLEGGGVVRSPSTHPGSRMTGSPPASDHSHRSQSINSRHSSEHRTRSVTYRTTPTTAQQQYVGVDVDLRMKPAFMQLLSALRALILKIIWRAQDSMENFQQQLTSVINELMQNKSVQKAWNYVSKQILPTVGWTGLSVFIVVVCTGFMQMWRQGANTLITWVS